MERSTQMTIKVLVVDRSAVRRRSLAEIVDAARGLSVVGVAANLLAAKSLIGGLAPDVLVVAVPLPGEDGVDFLGQLAGLRPMPVVLVSAAGSAASEAAILALESGGATELVSRPRVDDAAGRARFAAELTAKTFVAAKGGGRRTEVPRRVPRLAGAVGNPPIICVGASTGGTDAVRRFLEGMPADCPPILVVQHMPETFTASFAARLNALAAPTVLEARGNEPIEPGMVFVAPGHSHLRIKPAQGGYMTDLFRGPPVNHHRPSVDVLFESAAECVGSRAVGVILTGMGRDGALGLLKMRRAGARTYGQDEASSVVYGMPREADLIGAVEVVSPIDDMARQVLIGVGS